MALQSEIWKNRAGPAEPIFLRQTITKFLAIAAVFGAILFVLGWIVIGFWNILFSTIPAFLILYWLMKLVTEPIWAFLSETWPDSVPPGHVALIYRLCDGSYVDQYATAGSLIRPAGYGFELLDIRPITSEYKKVEIQTSDSYKLIVDISIAYHIEYPLKYQSSSVNADAIKANAISAISAVASECAALRLVALRNPMCVVASNALNQRLKKFGCTVDYLDMNPLELPPQLNAELRALADMKKDYPNIDDAMHIDLILARHGAFRKEAVAGSQERTLNIPGLSDALTAALRRYT